MGASKRRRNNGPAPQQTQGDSGRRGGRGGKIGIIIVSVIAVVGLAVYAGLRVVDMVNTNNANARILASDRFYNGVYVDGVSLGGLTRDEAARKVAEKQREYLDTLEMTVIDLNGGKTVLPVSALPEGACAFDTEAVLDAAWNEGRNGATDEEKLAYIEQLPENPVERTTTLTAVDPSSLEQQVRVLGDPFYVEPQNAVLDPTAYDPTKEGLERLSISQEVPGQRVDADRLWLDVQSSFTEMTFSDVQMTALEVPAEVTRADLEADLQLVQISPITCFSSSENTKLNAANEGHTYTSRIRDHSEQRLTNIRLANEAVSGIVMPGETFSMNQLTGDRTEAQGYQIAPIDRSGIVDKGLGGGVCQVSGTLYNAAVRYGGKYEVDAKTSDTTTPGLAITVRDSHSIPSAYMATGTDATVDIDSKKDLQFRNDFDKPVLIYMYYEKAEDGTYYEHCDIYGPPLEDGATYDLVRKNIKKLDPDTTTAPKTVYSKYATPGSPVYIEPRAGYSVDVYIEKNVNGEKTQVKAYTDSYKAQPAYYYVYVGETAPTPTPSETIAPSPSPSPTTAPTTAPTEGPTTAPTGG